MCKYECVNILSGPLRPAYAIDNALVNGRGGETNWPETERQRLNRPKLQKFERTYSKSKLYFFALYILFPSYNDA